MRTAIGSLFLMCLVLCGSAMANVHPASTTGFVGNVEGLWYYENTTYPIMNGFLVGDCNADGVADPILQLVDSAGNKTYIGCLSGSGKMNFNNSTTIWGWLTINNFVDGRDTVMLIDDVNNDGVKDIAVTNDTVGTSHVKVTIISGKNGALLHTNTFNARDVNFYYTLTKTIDIKLPQDNIGELLLVMNHSIPKSVFGFNYTENYLRIYVIDPTTASSIWSAPIDRGPLNFPYPMNPYLVTVSQDVSGNNIPDIFIATSGLNITFFTLTFNNSEIEVVDCQNQNVVWQRKDLTSGMVLDFRLWDFTGDGIPDAAMSKLQIGLSGLNPVIVSNTTEVLYGNNGTIASRLTHKCPGVFSGVPNSSLFFVMMFGPMNQFLISNFVDFSGDNVADILFTPFDISAFMGGSPAQSANITVINAKENATLWQRETTETITLAEIYPSDINTDSIKEIYVMQLMSSTNESKLSMYSGHDGTLLWVINMSASTYDMFWGMFASATPQFSDLNGDGYIDFVTVQDSGSVGSSEKIELTAINGKTGNAIYNSTIWVPFVPMENTTMTIAPMEAGDFSGDGKNDIGISATAQINNDTYAAYVGAINGTDGSVMWYATITDAEEADWQLFGAVMFGAMSGISPALCDLNGNGLSDDAIVGGSYSVYVVYTIPGTPVGELHAFACFIALAPVAFVYLIKRKTTREEKI